MALTILLAVILIFAVVVVIKSIALIPQGEAAVIERLGSYTRTVSGGLTRFCVSQVKPVAIT